MTVLWLNIWNNIFWADNTEFSLAVHNTAWVNIFNKIEPSDDCIGQNMFIYITDRPKPRLTMWFLTCLLTLWLCFCKLHICNRFYGYQEDWKISQENDTLTQNYPWTCQIEPSWPIFLMLSFTIYHTEMKHVVNCILLL